MNYSLYGEHGDLSGLNPNDQKLGQNSNLWLHAAKLSPDPTARNNCRTLAWFHI